jgi:hypothetical protein
MARHIAQEQFRLLHKIRPVILMHQTRRRTVKTKAKSAGMLCAMKRLLLATSLSMTVAFAASVLVAGTVTSQAQTISYADAIDRLAKSCGRDINKFCSKVHLGGGRVQQCLDKNQAKVSAQCKQVNVEVRALLQKRARARAAIPKVCDRDIRRLCSGVVQGDGHLLECFLKAERAVSGACRQAVIDAGYR